MASHRLSGLLASFGLNLVLNIWGLVIALVIVIAHLLVPAIPLWIAGAVLLAWLLIVFVVTLVLTLVMGALPSSSSRRGGSATVRRSSSGRYAYDRNAGKPEVIDVKPDHVESMGAPDEAGAGSGEGPSRMAGDR